MVTEILTRKNMAYLPFHVLQVFSVMRYPYSAQVHLGADT
jgi:hypothetical protein